MNKKNISSAKILILCLLYFSPVCSFADAMDGYKIGSHGQGHVKYPGWFKQSLLDLQGDLEDAKDFGKRGIIIMFSQNNCYHCEAFIETTLQDKTVKNRIRQNYDVIGLDIFNNNELTHIDGTETTVKDFAENSRARLTPTLLFIGVEKRILLKIIGFYPPEKFSHVLDYIEGNYHQDMKLRDYLLKAKSTNKKNSRPVQYHVDLFEKPPVSLIQSAGKSMKNLLVVFESPDCNPCIRFHQRVLKNQDVRNILKNFRSVQLDLSDNSQKITTPSGKEVTPKEWANQLQINYDVAAVFFDEKGEEVHRIDSEFGKDRFTGSMQYVLEKAYLRHEQFLQWRKEQAIRKKQLAK